MSLSLGETDVSIGETPDGRRLLIRRRVDASADAVWDVLTDTERWPDWGPSITAVDTPTRYIAAGTTGRVKTVAGLWVPYEITTCENHRWTWSVAGIPATGHVVESRPTGSVVGFEIPLLASGYAPVCARACGRIAALADRA
ncbi:SRPBCC family protein [Haloarcula marina]|uniref:SRPBCC family protein n=1 Tax=Haloarcula marina TaxID=2961574 RepID=UPI0020B80221|nr:SRPBCC family protein [Halomicroarcula marina]